MYVRVEEQMDHATIGIVIVANHVFNPIIQSSIQFSMNSGGAEIPRNKLCIEHAVKKVQVPIR